MTNAFLRIPFVKVIIEARLIEIAILTIGNFWFWNILKTGEKLFRDLKVIIMWPILSNFFSSFKKNFSIFAVKLHHFIRSWSVESGQPYVLIPTNPGLAVVIFFPCINLQTIDKVKWDKQSVHASS